MRDEFPYNMVCNYCNEIAYWVDRPFQPNVQIDPNHAREPGGSIISRPLIDCWNCGEIISDSRGARFEHHKESGVL